MNRALTQDECRDQRTILKILERNKLSEWMGGTLFYRQVICNIEAMQQAGTTDGEDLAELTDEDARERPWVMSSNNREAWSGPYRLLSGPPITSGYVCADNGMATLRWKYTRPLTHQEKERHGK